MLKTRAQILDDMRTVQQSQSSSLRTMALELEREHQRLVFRLRNQNPDSQALWRELFAERHTALVTALAAVLEAGPEGDDKAYMAALRAQRKP